MRSITSIAAGAALLCANIVLFAAVAHAASISILYISPSGGVKPGQQVTFYAAASGFTDAKYALTDSFGGSSVSGSNLDATGSFSWTPVVNDAGLHVITVSASDSSGISSATTTASILVLSNTIVISNISPGPVVSTNRQLTFTATAPGFLTPSFTVRDAYAGGTVSTANMSAAGVFTWTPATNEQGIHALTVSASDLYGHGAATTTSITVIAPTVALRPAIPSIMASAGTSLSFTGISSGLTNPTFSVADTFSGTSTVAASNINAAGVFIWTPSKTDVGTHTLTLTAADSYGNAASTTQKVIVMTAAAATPVTTPPVASTTSVATSTPGAQPPTAPTAGNGYVFTQYLSLGMQTSAVTELQKRLAALGVYAGPVTGYYGQLTAAAVRKFQISRGLESVGFVGPATRKALNGI